MAKHSLTPDKWLLTGGVEYGTPGEVTRLDTTEVYSASTGTFEALPDLPMPNGAVEEHVIVQVEEDEFFFYGGNTLESGGNRAFMLTLGESCSLDGGTIYDIIKSLLFCLGYILLFL